MGKKLNNDYRPLDEVAMLFRSVVNTRPNFLSPTVSDGVFFSFSHIQSHEQSTRSSAPHNAKEHLRF